MRVLTTFLSLYVHHDVPRAPRPSSRRVTSLDCVTADVRGSAHVPGPMPCVRPWAGRQQTSDQWQAGPRPDPTRFPGPGSEMREAAEAPRHRSDVRDTSTVYSMSPSAW